MTNTPAPGSPEAIALGCTCAVLDNNSGRGWLLEGHRMWWVTDGCPLHSPEAQVSADGESGHLDETARNLPLIENSGKQRENPSMD